MTANELKNIISAKIGQPVRVKTNKNYFGVSQPRSDGSYSWTKEDMQWLNDTFSSGDKRVKVCACNGIAIIARN